MTARKKPGLEREDAEGVCSARLWSTIELSRSSTVEAEEVDEAKLARRESALVPTASAPGANLTEGRRPRTSVLSSELISPSEVPALVFDASGLTLDPESPCTADCTSGSFGPISW